MRSLIFVLLGALTGLLAPSVQADSPWDGVRAWETATVVRVVDGDTVIVKDEVTGVKSRIRIIGVNAPELSECGGLAAQRVLASLAPKGTRVRLASSYQSSQGKNRPLRVVLAFNPVTGQFDHDLGWALAARGLGVWFTQVSEPALSSLYRSVVDQAQTQGLGLWSPGFCGPVSQPAAQLELRIGRSASSDPAHEWVTVRNVGTEPVDISNWVLRDSALAGRYTFPAGSYLVPGDWRTVHTGPGINSFPDGHDVYIGYSSKLYSEPGDGAYLLDQSGTFRSWREYPCTVDCELAGLSVTKVYPSSKKSRSGSVTVSNSGLEEACLDGFTVMVGSKSFSLGPNSCIPPGTSRTFTLGRVLSHGQLTLLSDLGSPVVQAFW